MCYKIAFAIVLSAAAISFSQESADDSSLARRQPEDRKTVEQIVRESRNSIVVVTTEGREGDQSGMGTGFVIDDVGLIATNLHVIGEARPVSVQFPNGERFSVKEIFASDRTLDLAILRIDFKDKLRSLSLADETAIAEFSEGRWSKDIGYNPLDKYESE